MRLYTQLRVGFVGVFSCLALLVGMFSFSGVALAHSANDTRNPEIRVTPRVAEPQRGCVEVTIKGEDFTPTEKWDDVNHAQFSAYDEDGRAFNVDPSSVRVNKDGKFSVEVDICKHLHKAEHKTVFVSAEDDATDRTSNTASFKLDF